MLVATASRNIVLNPKISFIPLSSLLNATCPVGDIEHESNEYTPIVPSSEPRFKFLISTSSSSSSSDNASLIIFAPIKANNTNAIQ